MDGDFCLERRKLGEEREKRKDTILREEGKGNVCMRKQYVKKHLTINYQLQLLSISIYRLEKKPWIAKNAHEKSKIPALLQKLHTHTNVIFSIPP